MDKKKMNLSLVSFATMDSTENPDSLNFSGTVAYVDTPSDYTPCGGVDGYKAVISSENIDVDSLVGSGVNAMWSEWFAETALKGHDIRFKIGVIDKAWVEDKEIKVSGHLWKSDFPDVCDTIECAKDSLGFSVEVYFDGIREDNENCTLTGLGAHFTGVAILYKSKAAFQQTKFMCAIKEAQSLTDEVQNALDEQSKKYDEKFAALTASIDALSKAVQEFSANKNEADEPTENEKVAADAPAMDFSALTEAVKAAVTEGFAAAKSEPTEVTTEAVAPTERKTVTEFSSTKQLADESKTVMQMSADIDNDDSLSAEQKWGAQLRLWNSHRDEFTKN